MQEMCEKAVENHYPLRFIPDHLKTQGMCNKAVEKDPYNLKYVPNQFKTRKMCEKAVEDDPETLKFVLNQYKAQWLCERAIEEDSYNLNFVPDRYKIQEMCNQAVAEGLSLLEYVPDWFVTREWMLMWYGDDEDKFFKWHDSYIRRKAQKALIKEELMVIAWHPSRHWDWSMSENEKKETEKLWK